MKKLEWTTETPTEPGWYLFRMWNSEDKGFVEVEPKRLAIHPKWGVLSSYFSGYGGECPPAKFVGSMWCGPLPVPPSPKTPADKLGERMKKRIQNAKP